MTDDPIGLFEAAALQACRVVDGVTPDQLGDPTPCVAWDVRALINHMVTGNLLFAALVAGSEQPERSADHLGDDFQRAFGDAVNALSGAFTKYDVLNGVFPTPFGEGPGKQLVMMRFNELVVHGWDLARATGQTDLLDPRLAEISLRALQSVPVIPRGDGEAFGAEVGAPPDAGPVERLAAFLGRTV
jgi:uncharacterized protein (TIGR03086 family)